MLHSPGGGVGWGSITVVGSLSDRAPEGRPSVSSLRRVGMETGLGTRCPSVLPVTSPTRAARQALPPFDRTPLGCTARGGPSNFWTPVSVSSLGSTGRGW